MKHKSKRFLSILLSLVMVLGLMPGMSMTARADADQSITTDLRKEQIVNSSLAPGIRKGDRVALN